MAFVKLDAEAAEAVAVCWLREIRDTELSDSENARHPEDRATARMRIAAIDVLLSYAGKIDND